METDGQGVYSVITTNDVDKKMKSEIDQISQVFSLSKSDATVILIFFRWNSFKASDRLGDDQEKLLSELGLVKVNSSNKKNEPLSSFADQENLVSTPFCPHKFSETCWISYLNNLLKGNNKEEERVLCPNPDCVASVGPDTIGKLTEPAVKEMYERYVMGSFVEANKESIQWCPAPGCEYVIERHEDLIEDDESSLEFGVVCFCGHTFCWSCKLESHRPVTCKNASLWFSPILDTLKSNAWLVENTKRCPHCNTPVQRSDDRVLRMITCICRFALYLLKKLISLCIFQNQKLIHVCFNVFIHSDVASVGAAFGQRKSTMENGTVLKSLFNHQWVKNWKILVTCVCGRHVMKSLRNPSRISKP